MNKQVKLGLVALLLASLCACGGPDKGKNMAKENVKTNQEVVANQEVSPDGESGPSKGVAEKAYPVSLTQAVDAFKKEYPQAQLTGVSFEEENGNFVYELEGKDPKQDYELQVHAGSGQILKQAQENENNPMIQALDLSQVKTEKEAMDAALAAAKSQYLYVKSWSLEVENKRPVYEVSLVYEVFLEKANQDDIEVKLDAKTLEVLDLDM